MTPAKQYGCDESEVKHYTCNKINTTLNINGDLTKPEWVNAVKSPRFVDMTDGGPAFYDTHCSALWNDEYLYIAFWAEEPYVTATITERDDLIFRENDLEVFIDGGDCYYELEVNALNTVYEVFFIWKDAYKKGGKFDVPVFDVHKGNAYTFGGNDDRKEDSFWTGRHPRGIKWAFLDYDMDGLQTAVQIDGQLNDPAHVDKGWTLEIAIPWKSMHWLANDRPLPPAEGDTWRIFFGRFQKMISGGQEIQPHPAWSFNKHGVSDTHVPECFTYVHFTAKN